MSSKKYLVLNILLCLVILVFAIDSYEIWQEPTEFLTDTGITRWKSEIKDENPPTGASTNELVSAPSYNLIAEKNIFSPERKDFPIPPAPAQSQKPIVRPQVILYGVAIGEGYKSATVIIPGRTRRKEEREALTLEVGAKIGEYRLAKILPDRITMKGNGDSFEVLLDDSRNPKRYVEPRPKSNPSMIAGLQIASAPNSGETPNPAPPQESVRKPTAQVQAQATNPPPFDRHTYAAQRIPVSATARGRRIFYQTPGSSPQGSVEKGAIFNGNGT